VAAEESAGRSLVKIGPSTRSSMARSIALATRGAEESWRAGRPSATQSGEVTALEAKGADVGADLF
jgi:hypothetical protein